MKTGILIAVLLLSISLVYAATNQNTDAQVAINNAAPTIITVTSISAQDPTENGVTNVEVNFTAEDNNGVDDINYSLAQGYFFKTGEVQRNDTLCANYQNDSAVQASFQCIIGMQYYDGAGTWTVNVSIADNSASVAYNDTTTFTYNTLKAFVMSPATLDWGSLSLGAADQEANNATTLNNTGNVVIADGGINVTAYNLRGQTDATKFINANVFDVNLTTGVGTGIGLANDTATTVTGATLPIGPAGSNQEQLFWFLDVPSTGLTAQTYSTSGYTAWKVEIN